MSVTFSIGQPQFFRILSLSLSLSLSLYIYIYIIILMELRNQFIIDGLLDKCSLYLEYLRNHNFRVRFYDSENKIYKQC